MTSTPREQARLGELPEATRSRVLRSLMMGDPILPAEARKLLAPPIPPEPPPRSLSTPELLAALPGRPDRVAHAAGRLAEGLKDPKSDRYYQGLAQAIARREHPPESLLRARSQGMAPRAERPGAVFATA